MKNGILKGTIRLFCLFLIIPALAFATVADNYEPVKTLGNGTTTEFSFGFALVAEGNIRVYLEDVVTGNQILETLGTDYTVEFDDETPGGTVTFTTPPSSDYYVIVSRDVEKTQQVPLTTSSGFQARVVEGALDKLTCQVQDLQEQANRALKVALGSDVDEIAFPPPVADKLIGWDSEGEGLENKDGLEETQAAAEAAQAAAELAETNAAAAETNAETAEANAEAAQSAAEAAAAGVNLPSIVSGDASKLLQVKTDESGYELKTIDALGVVDKTTAQTIAGVKEFSSFPVTPSSTPTSDYQVANKKTVDDSTTATPTANKALRMDSNAKLPVAALKIYDSGWFAVTIGTSYVKTHSLGTTKVLITVFISDTSDGSGKIALGNGENSNAGGSMDFTGVRALTTTTVTIRTGGNRLLNTQDTSGSGWQPTSGYARVVMLALE